jgi:hypothetical protein
MRRHARKTVLLGDLVVAAFDQAARFGLDPRAASRLALRLLRPLLERPRLALALR